MEEDSTVGHSDDSGSRPAAPPASTGGNTEQQAGMTIDGATELLLNQDTGESEDFFWPAVGR